MLGTGALDWASAGDGKLTEFLSNCDLQGKAGLGNMALGWKSGYTQSMEPTRHIEITPGTCSGRPRVRGTRIRVANVVRWTEQGQSPEEIVTDYPQISLADVHAALAFYFDNQEAMDRLIAEDVAFRASQETTHASISTEAGGDTVSS